MFNTLIKFALSFLLLFLPFKLLSQMFRPDADWRFENFNVQNHFINREISDMAFDKYGYVWTCGRGIQRFDGNKTSYFYKFDIAPGALRDNYDDVIADNTGRIWACAAGLCYYDDASNKFVYLDGDSKHKIENANACLVQKNTLWFVSDLGLAKVDTRTLKITFTSLANITDPLGTYLLDENTLLVSSREKVYIYNIKTNTYSTRILTYKGGLVKIFAVKKNADGFYLGTNLGLLISKNLSDFSLVAKETAGVEIDDLTFLPSDKKEQYLFIATGGKGVLVYDTALKKIEISYTHDDNNLYSLPSNLVNKFVIDKESRLWIATGLGISMLDKGNQQWKIRAIAKTSTDEVAINKIVRDKYDSVKVWMATNSHKMMCFNWETKKVDNMFAIDKSPDVQQIYDFVQTDKNKWLIITQKKIVEWSATTGILHQMWLPLPDSTILNYYIHRIIMVDADTYFITTNLGLFKYQLSTHKVEAASVNRSSPKPTDPLKYNLLNGYYDNGSLWIASRNGLFNYNIAAKKTTFYRDTGELPHYFFFSIAPAVNNQIVCGAGNGLTIFNKQTKKFTFVNTIANLYRPLCESVITVDNMVWANTDAGILTYNLDTHISSKAEYEDPLIQIFPGSPLAKIGNDIVLGFRNGFAYFKPSAKNTALPSDPVIEKVSINNQPALPYYPGKTGSNKLVLSPNNNSVNIAFTAFLYTDPAHIKFRYKLNTANAAWQYTDQERNANYAQLPPGDYTFYVQSGNKNGLWNNHMASFSFLIEPPYWAAWWFRLLVIVAIGLILYQLYSYRIRHLLAIERIRERIASDFHDDIGSALSSISIFSEVADKQLREQAPAEKTREIISHISHYSRSMLDAMDDIIWAVNPQNDHFNDLAVRMREFAIPLLEAGNINFEINIPEDILNTRVKMEARKNIFLIFKESINNILKHSGCSSMKVSVNKLGNKIELAISDNGKGFEVETPNTRNGLKNMHKRVAELKGTLSIKSAPGEGTEVRLVFNII
ncbi:triple tyrosine motif-containing protein [uncultured Mucilaginibacter sp.]|uniref:sensor histidine kinase n=2 Tax=uncultured Mucilaginibacter sp. TaxID=797541 RepID=UPI0025CEC9F4|nr:triple tyrosine motif-containing protein [uncultured Mucilaginibacter sp.]